MSVKISQTGKRYADSDLLTRDENSEKFKTMQRRYSRFEKAGKLARGLLAGTYFRN